MQTRILFLGTAGDALVAGKQNRSSGGIILTIEGRQFHIDPGPGALAMAKLMRVNLRESLGIFASGNDLVRTNDINAVISAMTNDGLDKRGVLVCPSSVIEGETFLTDTYRSYLEKAIIVDNTRKLAVANVDVQVIRLSDDLSKHCAFKFITPKFVLGYIPTTTFTKDLANDFQNTDVLIMAVQSPREYPIKGTMTTEDAEQFIHRTQPQLAVLTGFGIKMLQSDPLYEARQVQKATGVQVISAKDGMTINPVSFAATTRQSNLQKF